MNSWWRAVCSHLLMMRAHLLLMLGVHHPLLMLCVHHLLLMMHLLLIYGVLIRPMLIHAMPADRILTVTSISMLGHLIRVCLVCTNVWFVAVNIFSCVCVSLVFAGVLVPVFIAVHSCSLGVLFTGNVSSFSRSGCAYGSNVLSSFALPVGLIK